MTVGYLERPLTKTKIIATVGPACSDREVMISLVKAGVDLFRINMAHGEIAWKTDMIRQIRSVAEELGTPLGVLGDLSGPKIRLEEIAHDEIHCHEDDEYLFVRERPNGPTELSSTYEHLVDDLQAEDRLLIADGQVEMKVLEKADDRLRCIVTRAGTIRSRQGINLPGVHISSPSLTAKDRVDLNWMLQHGVDYIGLSFVRSARDLRELHEIVDSQKLASPPRLVAKIEKIEAVNDLENIIRESDAVMVARGDLGVEVDISRVPMLQKRIIRLCNSARIPVITATQMLDSMTHNEFPTRAEASDVANAVLDGSDAVMLSGETAVGSFPVRAVGMMSRLAQEAERMVTASRSGEWEQSPRTRATVVTEGVTIAASAAAEFLNADMIVVSTHTGRTAMAISRQRGQVPIVALTDQVGTARQMTLYWGVKPMRTDAVRKPAQELIQDVVEWGRTENVLDSGSRIVLVSQSDWTESGHDLLLVHVVR